jgi:uncharacterized membrane protein (DUF4010 family)
VIPRVLFLCAIVAPSLLVSLAPPLVAMFAILLGLSGITYLLARRDLELARLDHAPSDLRAAVVFGLLYAAVLLSVAAARRWLGPGGLYAVAAASGLTDLDAITLSTVQMARAGRIEVTTGWQLIVIGVTANLVFKAGAAIALGHPRLRRWVLCLFGSAIALALVLLLVWPGP